MTIVVRPAVAADRPALRDLFLRSRRAAFAWEPGGSDRADFDRETDGETLRVAHDGGRPVGFVSIWPPDHFVHHLHVHPERTRRGIGRTLLQALPGWPHTPYRLKCLGRNEAALAFYRACRFVEIGRGWADGEEYLLLESAPDLS